MTEMIDDRSVGIGFAMDEKMMNMENVVFTVESQKAVPAPFLTKTYHLVDDPRTDHIVSWGQHHTTFVVWRPPDFARDILPNYFKHNNFSSFVRQLNTYGFKKIVADRWEFGNENFRKGAKQLLSEIHRRKSHHNHHYQQHYSSPPQPLQFFHPDHEQQINICYSAAASDFLLPSPSPSSDSDVLTALTQDNQRLRRKNYMLSSELTHMKTLYRDIVYFIQNHVKPVEYDQKSRRNCSVSKLVDSPFEVRSAAGCMHNSRIRSLGKSSVTLPEEPNGTVKLFGVSLRGKKRQLPEEIDGNLAGDESPVIVD